MSEGTVLIVEKLARPRQAEGEAGEHESDKVIFDEVLLVVDGEDVKIGKPFISGVKVEAKIIEDGKSKKKMVFRYKAKTRRRKKKGHRQPYTKVQITKIVD